MIETYIAAPLVGALVVWLSRDFVIPYVSGLVNRVPSLKGNWTISRKLENGNKIELGVLIIHQNGKYINATLTGKNECRIFKFSGYLSSGQVLLTFEEKGGEGFIIGAMVFRIDSKRKRMIGRSLYWRHNDNIMAGEDFEAIRP